MNKFARPLALVSALTWIALANATKANADVIYSSFGPGTNQYSIDSAVPLYGANIVGVGGAVFYGMKFNSGATSYNLTSIDVPLAHDPSRPNSTPTTAAFFLYSDIGTPGLPIATIGVSPTLMNDDVPGQVYNIAASPGITLDANTNYWIVGAGGTSDSAAMWFNRHADSAAATYSLKINNGAWSAATTSSGYGQGAAVRVNGTAISAPEPGALSLLALGAVAGLGVLRRRTKR